MDFNFQTGKNKQSEALLKFSSTARRKVSDIQLYRDIGNDNAFAHFNIMIAGRFFIVRTSL
jgi:hypothetical protein